MSIIKVGIIANKHNKAITEVDELLIEAGYDINKLRYDDWGNCVDYLDYGREKPDFKAIGKYILNK